MIRAQYLGHLLDNISVEPGDCGADDDHRRHADDDADQGEKSAQLVRQDRLQGDPGGVRIK